jgi:O-antigen ligase
MTALSTTARFDRASLRPLADWLAVAVALALPWSTSVASIGIAAWLLVALATLDVAGVRREIATPAGGLPVLLWVLGAIGMLWADVSWHERFQGLDGFDRLLIVPLLLAQFRRSEHGIRVLYGFFISSVALLIASYALALIPALTWRGNLYGVPVHDDIFQNADFLICAFAALGIACAQGRKRHWSAMLALLAVATLFLANIAFVFTSRVALLVLPVLALLLGWRELRWKGIASAVVLAAVVGVAAWFASPPLRARIDNSVAELRDYRTSNTDTSIGEHAAFLNGSLKIIAAGPLFGHGTGSIVEQFRLAAAGETGTAALAPDNPHNQTFAVAIQLGVVGAIVLWAMWVAHFWLFRGGGLAAWCGAVIVVENIVSSTAHSHLFDFNNGWLYVFGVGVAGSMVLHERELSVKPPSHP